MRANPETYFWILVCLRVLGTILDIALIGRKREPRTAADAAINVAASALVVAFAAWMLL